MYLREINCDGTVPVAPETDASASTTGAEPLGVSRRRAAAETDDIDGIGSTDADPFVGVDLDDCREHDSGTVDDVARDVVARLDSYLEVSAPGTGLHVRGVPPGRA